jgi:TPR repeat protein
MIQRTSAVLVLLVAVAVLPAVATAGPCPKKEFRELKLKQVVKAAEKGCVPAMRELQFANIYEPGESVSIEHKTEDRLRWLLACADGGLTECRVRAAYYLAWGMAFGKLPIPKDEARALKYVDAVIASGDVKDPSAMKAAEKLANGLRSAETWRQAASAGDIEAVRKLADIYSQPIGFGLYISHDQFPPERDHWLGVAMKANHPDVLRKYRADNPANEAIRYDVGTRLSELHGITDDDVWVADYALNRQRDLPAAKRWYKKLNDRKVTGAAAIHAMLSDAKVYALMEAAYADKAGQAKFELANYFGTPGNAHANPARALNWYREAMALGHVEAAYQVGLRAYKHDEQHTAMAQAAHAGKAEAKVWIERARAEREAAQAQREREMQIVNARGREESLRQQREFISRVDREGPSDGYEVELYCAAGGSRCQSFRAQAVQQERRNNAAADAYNQQRLQNVYSGDSKSQQQRDKAYRDRSECLQRKAQAIQNNAKGQADYFQGDC